VTTVKAITSFKEANQYLASFYENIRVDRGYSLDNMRHLLSRLGNPQDSLQVVHVAGTSGKTSTAYYLSSLLTATGCKVGLTVSPHVVELNERLQINSQPLGEAVFCEALTTFLALIENSRVQPTWFEAMITFAYWYFAQQQVDYAIVEVGLGGLKDGTNVVSRADKVCVITDIGKDHTEVLGNSLGEIAEQKFGIVQPHNSTFMFKQSEEVMQVAKRVSSEAKASLTVLNFATEKQTYADDLINLAEYQQRNWLLAYYVFTCLVKRDKLPNLTHQALRQTQAIQIPGRMDIQKIHDKIIVMDGAHNVQKMAAFINSFTKLYPDAKPAVLISLKEGKDYQDVAHLLASLASQVITTSFTSTQDLPLHSIDPTILAEAFRAAGVLNVESIDDQQTACQTLLNLPDKILVITGSFYLLGQIRNNGYLQ